MDRIILAKFKMESNISSITCCLVPAATMAVSSIYTLGLALGLNKKWKLIKKDVHKELKLEI